MYRIFYRGGDYVDVHANAVHTAIQRAPAGVIWAAIDLDIREGGDAYQALVAALDAVPQ